MNPTDDRRRALTTFWAAATFAATLAWGSGVLLLALALVAAVQPLSSALPRRPGVSERTVARRVRPSRG